MSADAVYLVAGVALLVGVVLPALLDRLSLSVPMVLIGVGMLVGLLSLPVGTNLDPIDLRPTIEHVAELAVLVALMGVGLALDRPLSLRRRGSWRAWGATWRLLLVAMPLCIGAVFVLGHWVLGLAPAAALLLGAVLAPTDPVLAGDVQVEGPDIETTPEELDEEDEVRFSLTSEAGLNDGLAFPFVYAAIFLVTLGSPLEWGLQWLAWDLVGRVVIGVGVGWLVGRVLAALAFRAPARSLRTAETGEPLLALAAILGAYGAAEVAQGYGFLAVFTCAMTLRSLERSSEYHRHMHEVVERLERLMVLIILLFIGIELTRGVLDALDWRGIVAGLALILVIRPLAASLSLRFGVRRGEDLCGLDRRERAVVAFFGVRGIGSVYYLAYALGQAEFPDARWLWSTVAFTIVASVVIHGVSVNPAMRWVERHRGPQAEVTST